MQNNAYFVYFYTKKSDGLSGTESGDFFCASQWFKMLVAVMLNAMFVHGHMPTTYLILVTIDLKSDLCNFDNYHCPTLSNVVDIVMIKRHEHILLTSGI